jgi:hypothetical protein
VGINGAIPFPPPPPPPQAARAAATRTERQESLILWRVNILRFPPESYYFGTAMKRPRIRRLFCDVVGGYAHPNTCVHRFTGTLQSWKSLTGGTPGPGDTIAAMEAMKM